MVAAAVDVDAVADSMVMVVVVGVLSTVVSGGLAFVGGALTLVVGVMALVGGPSAGELARTKGHQAENGHMFRKSVDMTKMKFGGLSLPSFKRATVPCLLHAIHYHVSFFPLSAVG